MIYPYQVSTDKIASINLIKISNVAFSFLFQVSTRRNGDWLCNTNGNVLIFPCGIRYLYRSSYLRNRILIYDSIADTPWETGARVFHPREDLTAFNICEEKGIFLLTAIVFSVFLAQPLLYRPFACQLATSLARKYSLLYGTRKASKRTLSLLRRS